MRLGHCLSKIYREAFNIKTLRDLSLKLVLILAISACAGNVNTSDEAPFDLTPIPVLDGSTTG